MNFFPSLRIYVNGCPGGWIHANFIKNNIVLRKSLWTIIGEYEEIIKLVKQYQFVYNFTARILRLM